MQIGLRWVYQSVAAPDGRQVEAGQSDCSRCVDCSRCSYIKDKNGAADSVPRVRPPTPVIPDIHRAVYAVASAPQALNMAYWHWGATHCRAGWMVTLAGEAGAALEAATSTLHAAILIYRASDPTWRMSNFFDDNVGALADMKRLAEAGQARQE